MIFNKVKKTTSKFYFGDNLKKYDDPNPGTLISKDVTV